MVLPAGAGQLLSTKPQWAGAARSVIFFTLKLNLTTLNIADFFLIFDFLKFKLYINITTFLLLLRKSCSDLQDFLRFQVIFSLLQNSRSIFNWNLAANFGSCLAKHTLMSWNQNFSTINSTYLKFDKPVLSRVITRFEPYTITHLFIPHLIVIVSVTYSIHHWHWKKSTQVCIVIISVSDLHNIYDDFQYWEA